VSDEKQIYGVAVTVKLHMCVVANSREEAHEIALQHFPEELDNEIYSAVAVSATQLNECPDVFKLTIPWGVTDDDPRRDWFVDRWFKEQGKKD